VRAEQHLFDVQTSDRVFQGFSVAFDAAVEETWLAFAAGATLVLGAKEVMVSDLAGTLAKYGVTVLSTVPTLLSVVEGDLPTVRLLIVGGEACPQSIVDRFATGSRAVFNTYGPTETTVIATYARLRAGRRVTIGRPVPNYRTYILDDRLQLLPAGVAGEICIGGIGLARGYVGRPELTAARFVPNPYAAERGAPPVLYRTGDRGRYDAQGNIEFLGRIDDQVKLRGFRIELGEVEAALVDGGAAQAVALVHHDTSGHEQLVAYVVPSPGSIELSADALKERLRVRLPPYMIPAAIEVVAAMPTLTSGKVDKKSLPPPSQPPPGRVAEDDRPQGPLEEKIASSWAELLCVPTVSRDGDFFKDLGGHSLLAAQMVSRLRRMPELAGVSVRDVYDCPTVAKLADRYAHALVRTSEAAVLAHRVSPWSHLVCGLAQLVALYGVFGGYSLQWLGPYLAYMALRHADVGVGLSLVVGLVALCGVPPLMLLAALATKWIVIGRFKPGRYPLWGAYYFRCWLVDNVLELAPTGFLAGTPLLSAYYRLFGARIGKNVHLGSDGIGPFDLIAIGDDSTLDAEADLRGSTIEDGMLVLGSVRIGKRCVVGPRAVLTHDVTMNDDSVLGELSLLPPGGTIGACERWEGSPARLVSRRDGPGRVVRPSARQKTVLSLAYGLVALALPLYVVAALLPGLVLLTWLDGVVGFWCVCAAPIVATVFVVLLCLEIAATKWLLLGRVRPGQAQVHGWFFFRKWAFDQAMGLSLDELGSLYATVFLNPWYRLLGVHLGKNSEISTASGASPDLLHIGDEAFIADCVSLGAPWIERGMMDLRETRIGKRSFIGNSGVVPGGTTVGDDCLVGCLSIAPERADDRPNCSWFGSPPVTMPLRQTSTAFPVEATYKPTRMLRAQRRVFDAIRVTLPTSCFVLLSCCLIRVALAVWDLLPLGAFVALFPLLYVGFGLAAAGIVVALKWIVVGRYRPGEHPLWSRFVWRAELVTAMHENLANPFFVDKLDGTPFVSWFFRALGAKIGKRVYMGTTELTEYDLVTVGDEACLNEDCTLQTHLFEDRVMKVSNVHVGARCTVGSGAVVLYDAEMEEGSKLGSLSLLMKGETLPAWSSWEGSPARLNRCSEVKA
jgi:non-ribosomal peptide synthetase-like protein